MDISAYKDEVLFKLTGGVLKCELDDASLTKVINAALREIQRYIDTTALITIPYQHCIDMTPYKVCAVAGVFRAQGFAAPPDGNANPNSPEDPMYAAQWQLLSGVGNMYNFNDYVYNYASYNTLLQIRNTTSTDLAFRFDKHSNKLYINIASNYPTNITIEYIPRFEDVSEITSDYWIDILTRMSVAIAKVTLGRIRSRYKQTNALWEQDGDAILSEGNEELTALRQELKENSQLIYPID